MDMKTPKYDIGKIFYSASFWGPGPGKFTFCPTAMVIVGIIIDRKGISYKTKKLLYKDDDTIADAEEMIMAEKDLNEKYFHSINEITDAIKNALTTRYQEIDKQFNKEKLSAVLHGE
jgi:hypothetical protein